MARLRSELGRKGSALQWTEQLLWVIGIVCLAVVLYVLADARWFAFVQGRRLDQALRERSAAGAPAPAQPGSARGVNGAAPSSPASQTDNLEAFRPAAPPPPPDEGALIGRIEIPRIGISSLVLQGVESQTLHRGVGHIPNTALPPSPGNVGLAGHRDTVFGGLKDIRQGDLITLDTLNGSFRYVVDWSRIVEPTDIIVLAASNRPELTLVTCYPFHYVGPAPQRFVVRAHRVDDPGPQPVPGS